MAGYPGNQGNGATARRQPGHQGSLAHSFAPQDHSRTASHRDSFAGTRDPAKGRGHRRFLAHSFAPPDTNTERDSRLGGALSGLTPPSSDEQVVW